MDSASVEARQSASAAGVPRTTRGLVIVAVVLTLVARVPGLGGGVSAMLALVPQSTIGRMYLWNVGTAGLFEAQPLASLFTIPALALLGRWVEPIWGGKELAIFAIFVNTFAGIATFVMSMLAYFVTRSQVYIFTPIASVSCISFGLLVAIKQLIPEHRLSFWGVGLQIGALKFAWIYLRFLQRRELGRGDSSDTFAVHTFYPEPIASVVRPIAFITFQIFKPFLSALQIPDGLSTNGISSGGLNGKAPIRHDTAPVPLSTVDPVDAERRRQRALAALDARLGASKSDAYKHDDSV